MTRKAVTMVAVLALSATTAACSSKATVSDPTPSETSANAKLTIGIAGDLPGISQKVGDDYAGFDVQTAKYVAAKLGVPVSGITWKTVLPADREKVVEDGSVNLLFDTYSITDERKQKVDFAGPYFVAHQDLLIRRNDVSITGPTTLDGKSVCSLTNTTSIAYIKSKYAGKITLVEKPNYSDCVKALADGDVDAVTTDDLILAGFAAQPQYRGILKLVGKGFTDEKYGVGIKKGDTEMVNKVNAALKSYISDGTWKQALDAYVAPSGYSVPAPPTVGG